MSLNIDRSSWTRVKFGDVVTNVNDNVKDPTVSGIERLLGLEHLDPGELAIARWGTVSDETTFTRRVRPGQTLFGKRRAYQRKTAYAEFDAICSGDILVFTPKDPVVLLPELLPFIVSTDSFYARALETSAGSLSPRTRWSDLAKYEFDLPPLAEQRRIADLLWTIESQRKSLLSLRRCLDGAARTLLGALSIGPRQVADVVTMARSGATPLREKREYFGGEIPWLKSGEVVGSHITTSHETLTELGLSKSAARLIPAGATCVALYGDGKTRGSVGRLGVPMATNQAVLALVADETVCEPEFLYIWMLSRTASLRDKSAGGAQKNLNKSLVVSEPFPDASLADQQAVVARFRSISAADAAVELELVAVEELARASRRLLHNGELT